MHYLKARRILTLLIAGCLVAACASYSGDTLKPGTANLDDVIRVMGQPAMRWQEPDGSVQLAYPRGPYGFHTYMAHFSADGKLLHIENVLTPQIFTRITPGMTEAEVEHVLGPPAPSRVTYFERRDELVWTWRYCDDLSEVEHFHVLFDRTRGTVRSTESMIEWCGDTECLCAR